MGKTLNIQWNCSKKIHLTWGYLHTFTWGHLIPSALISPHHSPFTSSCWGTEKRLQTYEHLYPPSAQVLFPLNEEVNQEESTYITLEQSKSRWNSPFRGWAIRKGFQHCTYASALDGGGRENQMKKSWIRTTPGNRKEKKHFRRMYYTTYTHVGLYLQPPTPPHTVWDKLKTNENGYVDGREGTGMRDRQGSKTSLNIPCYIASI